MSSRVNDHKEQKACASKSFILLSFCPWHLKLKQEGRFTVHPILAPHIHHTSPAERPSVFAIRHGPPSWWWCRSNAIHDIRNMIVQDKHNPLIGWPLRTFMSGFQSHDLNRWLQNHLFVSCTERPSPLPSNDWILIALCKRKIYQRLGKGPLHHHHQPSSIPFITTKTRSHL